MESSTLLNLILGLYIPNSGNIYTGNINSIKHRPRMV